MASTDNSDLQPTPERAQELKEALTEVRGRTMSASCSGRTPTLIAVSKYKPTSDILACYQQAQLDFGENYVQELVKKASLVSAR
jgi:hypothetical protein